MAPDVVMTAAHCAGNITTVVVGLYNLSDLSGNVQNFTVSEEQKHIHSMYNPYTNENDVLLIKLDGNITVVDPVRVNDNSSVPIATDTLAVVGWGATNVTKQQIEYPEILQEVELYYVPNLFCKRVKSVDGFELDSMLYDDMMCATNPGKDSCYGDSGGPLIFLGASPADDVQVGITSWGDVCGGKIPGVYSRLSHSYEWIKNTVCSISTAPPDSFRCFSSAPTTPPETTGAPTTAPVSSTTLPVSTQDTRAQSMAAQTRLGWAFGISFFLAMVL